MFSSSPSISLALLIVSLAPTSKVIISPEIFCVEVLMAADSKRLRKLNKKAKELQRAA